MEFMIKKENEKCGSEIIINNLWSEGDLINVSIENENFRKAFKSSVYYKEKERVLNIFIGK